MFSIRRIAFRKYFNNQTLKKMSLNRNPCKIIKNNNIKKTKDISAEDCILAGSSCGLLMGVHWGILTMNNETTRQTNTYLGYFKHVLGVICCWTIAGAIHPPFVIISLLSTICLDFVFITEIFETPYSGLAYLEYLTFG